MDFFEKISSPLRLTSKTPFWPFCRVVLTPNFSSSSSARPAARGW